MHTTRLLQQISSRVFLLKYLLICTYVITGISFATTKAFAAEQKMLNSTSKPSKYHQQNKQSRHLLPPKNTTSPILTYIKRTGIYRLADRKQHQDGYVSLLFRYIISHPKQKYHHSQPETEKQEALRLNVWHAPAIMKKGFQLRIAADVFSDLQTDKTPWREIYQMLAYLPRKDGSYHPVWFISKDYTGTPKQHFSYLQMHVPAFDYLSL